MPGATVLIVEADPGEQGLLGDWLERAVFEVLTCPGPSGPDYVCVGNREGTCPLVQHADIVVLDFDLESESVMQGTTSEELVELYLDLGRPIVALGAHLGPLDPFPDERVLRLPRHPDHELLVDAVKVLAAPGSAPTSSEEDKDQTARTPPLYF